MNNKLNNSIFFTILFVISIYQIVPFYTETENIFFLMFILFTILYIISYTISKLLSSKYAFYIPVFLLLGLAIIGIIILSINGVSGDPALSSAFLLFSLIIVCIMIVVTHKIHTTLLENHSNKEMINSIVKGFLPLVIVFGIVFTINHTVFNRYIGNYTTVQMDTILLFLICFPIGAILYGINPLLIKMHVMKESVLIISMIVTWALLMITPNESNIIAVLKLTAISYISVHYLGYIIKTTLNHKKRNH